MLVIIRNRGDGWATGTVEHAGVCCHWFWEGSMPVLDLPITLDGIELRRVSPRHQPATWLRCRSAMQALEQAGALALIRLTLSGHPPA